MKVIHILVFCMASAVFSACGDHKTNTDAKDISAPVPQTGVDMPATSLAVSKDLVCGMELKDGSIGDTTVYQSKVYGFCSPECKGEFKKNPSQYLTQK